MKAISLHQPWAHLVAKGAKRYETRSWKTDYRGLLAIHATKNYRAMAIVFADTKGPVLKPPFDRHLKPAYHWLYGDLSNGGIVAICELQHIESAPSVANELREHAWLNPAGAQAVADELAFGDFSAGRWAWSLRVLVSGHIYPRQVRGYQRLWNLPADVEQSIRSRCRECNVHLP